VEDAFGAKAVKSSGSIVFVLKARESEAPRAPRKPSPEIRVSMAGSVCPDG